MASSKPFRFGVNMLAPGSRAEWVAKCRKAESLGFDVVAVADHLGLPAPFPALMLAAEVTERVRLNTFVLNTSFYNPALLAREVATTDAFTDGRFELGLGAGYVKAEFDAAQMVFPRAGERIDHIERTVREMRKLFSDPEFQPRPAQPSGPPLMLAGWGDRMLALAAGHADIVALTGGVTNRTGSQVTVADSVAVDARISYVRTLLGDRADEVEYNILVQRVEPADSRAALAEALVANLPAGAADVDDIPALLIGSPRDIADTLRERRDRFGFSYITVLEPNMDKLAPVIELLR
ncbi:MAG: LLM class F420-dependent oxidoreductase [Mycobacteriaceae bacterium]|nr:LLM class F420-dependent oxidoreductase [Mycobacteriaceae bacterium]